MEGAPTRYSCEEYTAKTRISAAKRNPKEVDDKCLV